MRLVNPIAWTPDQWAETLAVVATLAAAVVVALVVSWLISALVRALAGANGAGELLARALRGPLGALIIVQAFFLALRRLSYLQGDVPVVERAWLATTIVVLVYGAQRLIVPLTQWYADRSTAGRTRLHSLPPLQRALRGLIWVSGLLVVLATVGIEISPLLAGLGLSGLAVALALQPLLANVFASSYLLSDQSIRIGDAIRVEGGPAATAEGIVEDIGWRATRIRTVDHNLAIIPNSVLAQSTMTNFDAMSPETDVTLTFSVSIEADLVLVERVCLDELARVRDEASDLADTDAPVSVQYQSFEERGVAVVVRVRARSSRTLPALRHRLLMALHARLRSEGVTLA